MSEEGKSLVVTRLREAGLRTDRFVEAYRDGSKNLLPDEVMEPDQVTSRNCGVMAGRPNEEGLSLVVLDVDEPDELPEDVELPETFTVESPHDAVTPGRGHLWYAVQMAHPPCKSNPAWGSIRGAGWGAFCPGSVLSTCDRDDHDCSDPGEGRYRPEDRPIAVLPVSTLEALAGTGGEDERGDENATTTPATTATTATTTPPGVPEVGWTAFEDDDQLIAKATDAGNGEFVQDLLDGRWKKHTHRWVTGDDDGPSEAWSALCWALAFWSRDPDQIDRIVCNSDLIPHPDEPGKWDRTGPRTIRKAIQGNSKFYTAGDLPELVEDEHATVSTDGGRVRVSRRAIEMAYRAMRAAGGTATTTEVAESVMFDPVGEGGSKRHARRVLDYLETSGFVRWTRDGNDICWQLADRQ